MLVVDDEEMLRITFQRVLHGSGRACECAASAEEASDRLAERAFDLVVLDINMPGRSGIDLLAEIKGRHPDMAVLMVTAIENPEQADRAIELGACGYMIKPVRATELRINVDSALRQRAMAAELRLVRAELDELRGRSAGPS